MHTYRGGVETHLPPFAALGAGAHIIVFGDASVGMSARTAGFEVRDCILVAGPETTCTAWLLRKPIAESTVAAQVLKTGTGALWIDGCRIGTSGGMTKHTTWAGSDAWGGNRTTGVWVDHGGRWPTNILFVHGPGCRLDGTKDVKPGNGSGTAVRHKGVSNAVAYGGNIGRLPEGTPDLGYVSEDGKETVAAWNCAQGCLVAALNGQSGELTSGTGAVKRSTASGYQGNAYGKENRAVGAEMLSYGDTGTASRFYPQHASFEDVVAWLLRLVLPEP
jgi:hypothetical protein